MICLLMSAAGKPTVHIDFCLCCVTARDWSSGALPMTFKLAYLRVLLDVVYFFWYDERQLARGAIFLRKVDASGAAQYGAVPCFALFQHITQCILGQLEDEVQQHHWNHPKHSCGHCKLSFLSYLSRKFQACSFSVLC